MCVCLCVCMCMCLCVCVCLCACACVCPCEQSCVCVLWFVIMTTITQLHMSPVLYKISLPYCSFFLQMLSANMDGELVLKIETDTVSVATYFKELINHQFGMRDTKYDTVERLTLN